MDKYILGQSKMGSITEGHRKAILNLNLQKNPYCNNALIYGNTMTMCEEPIEDAKIMFFDENNNKIGSVFSSKDGFYAFYEAKLYSRVKIIVKKSGYKTKISDFIELYSEMIKYNIYMKKSCISKHSLISGHLIDNNNLPLKGITIYLLDNICSCETMIYKATNTNSYGQFVFSDVPKGIYEIFINDPSFEIYKELIEITGQDKIIDINIKLNKKEPQTKIMGQIKDANNKPIPYSIVVLFKVNDDGKLIPISHTVCDSEGIYCFTNIPFNNYIVKAK